MGCTGSKSKKGGASAPGGGAAASTAPPEPAPLEEEEAAEDAADGPVHEVSQTLPDGQGEVLPPATDVPPGTVRFSQQSHTCVDLSVAGDARSRAELGWLGCCWSEEEVSATGPYRGVRFSSTLNYVMPGLKAGPSSKKDSYADFDYGLYCSPSGRIQVYERGLLVHTDKGKYLESSVLEVRIAGSAVEYVVDGRVVYVSQAPPPTALHFGISWYDHPAAVTGIQYVKGG